MTREGGAKRIFFYNWPIYLGTWAVAVASYVASARVGGLLGTALAVAASIAVASSFASLAISFYIYDRSDLVQGLWVAPLLRGPVRTWATIHAGLDAEVDLDGVMPGSCVGRLDIFDARVMTSSSIRRARERTATLKAAIPCAATSLPLASESCDAIVVAFTAHEIRDLPTRERFFEELRRALRPGGQLLVVEHLRDLANFIAFGPGFLHFVPRRKWLRLASKARFEVAREVRITPWVMALVLERPG